MERHESICLEKIAKSYNELERQLNLWRETDCHSGELIQSLRSPLDQLHTCERVNFENSSLADFKDLKRKLEYKLLKQTECILAKLHLDLETFQSVAKKISALWSSCFEVYSSSASSLSMSVVCEGTPTQPPISDLLEWLSDLDRMHLELYEEKAAIYSRLTYTASMAKIDKAIKDWRSTKNWHANEIRDIMEQVAVFLASRG
ncbi:AFG2-interacting ribosome maturation factor-like isoform X2 [Acropora palmata]|uniref:AFG2-interacting ribosome maturation factor-like isoform X2 n=1 Tax=Acropora palmata TaxID=6131 RepID=UPI003DA179DF